MKGIGLSKTDFRDIEINGIYEYKEPMDLFKILDIINSNNYSYYLDENNELHGRGVLVCYKNDLNNITQKLKKCEILYYTITRGVIQRVILSNGIALIRLTNIVKIDDIEDKNLVNFFYNSRDIKVLRNNFNSIIDNSYFLNTKLDNYTYQYLKNIFKGGVMNICNTDGVESNVKSYDLISAYISHMLGSYYPMGRFNPTKQTIEVLDIMRKKQPVFYIGLICLRGVKIRNNFIGIINIKQLSKAEGNLEYNDCLYITEADCIYLPITEYFLDSIRIVYTYESIEVKDLYACYEGGYLPDPVREYIAEKYEKKMKAKRGSEEREVAKLEVNMCYGFTCVKTENYGAYKNNFSIKYPYQWGVYTCLYTTYVITLAMANVVLHGGRPICVATDSIKYSGDYELPAGNNLGDFKYEGEYKKAYIKSPYRALYEDYNGNITVKLAGCVNENAVEYFNTHPHINILYDGIVIPDGSIRYEINKETNTIDKLYSDYKIGCEHIEI